LHGDLNIFMTSWVTDVALVSNILTDFLVPVVTSVTKVTSVHWLLWFPEYARSDVLCTFPIMLTRMGLTIMNLFSPSLMSQQQYYTEVLQYL